MAWLRAAPFVIGDQAWDMFPNVARLKTEISARPAAIRAEALKERHAFKAEMDAEARKHIFRHLKG